MGEARRARGEAGAEAEGCGAREEVRVRQGARGAGVGGVRWA